MSKGKLSVLALSVMVLAGTNEPTSAQYAYCPDGSPMPLTWICPTRRYTAPRQAPRYQEPAQPRVSEEEKRLKSEQARLSQLTKKSDLKLDPGSKAPLSQTVMMGLRTAPPNKLAQQWYAVVSPTLSIPLPGKRRETAAAGGAAPNVAPGLTYRRPGEWSSTASQAVVPAPWYTPRRYAAPFKSQASAVFYDPVYRKEERKQHTGIDIPGKAGSEVNAPISGRVIGYYGVGNDRFMIIQEQGSKTQHVLGHIEAGIPVGAQVTQQTIVGRMIDQGLDTHVHWGANSNGIPIAPDAANFGWGKAPLASTPEEAKARGWIDLTEYVR